MIVDQHDTWFLDVGVYSYSHHPKYLDAQKKKTFSCFALPSLSLSDPQA